MSEAAVVVLMLIVGWMILAAAGLDDWGIVPLGFVVGTNAFIGAGFLLTVSGLPTGNPWIVSTAVAGALLYFLLSPRRAASTYSVLRLVVGSALVGVLAIVFRQLNLVSYHIDSFRYLVGSGLLARNSYEVASLNLAEARGLSSPLVHSLARGGDEWYLASHGPLLFAAVLGTVAWLLSTIKVQRSGVVAAYIGAAGAVGLIATNNRMVFSAFYVNDHLLFAACWLVICSAGWVLSRVGDVRGRAMYVAMILAIPVLVVTRPEGFIFAGLAALPLLLDGTIDLRLRRGVLGAFSLGMFMWFGYLSLVAGGSGVTILGPLALAGLGVLILPFLGMDRATGWRHQVLWCVEALIWLALGLFALRDPAILADSLRATYHNVVLGVGSWGYSLMILAVLVLVSVGLRRPVSLLYLRFPLTTAAPTLFLLAYLREGAYRVGHGDSLNRMLMHVVPLGVLFITATALSLIVQGGTTDGPPGMSRQHDVVTDPPGS